MKRSVIILLHLAYWICFLLLIAFILISIQQGRDIMPGKNLVKAFYTSAIIPGVIAFYSFYTFLFSKFLTKKRMWAFFLLGILVSIISGIAGALALSVVFGPRTLFADGFRSAYEITVAIALMVAVPNGTIGLVLKGFITWYGDIKVKEELNRKNYEIELELIKSQINPHFLFNTINNIDVLITKDPVKASDYLIKLSDIMRFMLYETKTGKIAMEKELSYIEKYIALQSIRTSKEDYVDYIVKGNTGHLMVEPFLFIPFIENAFKHAGIADNAIRVEFIIEDDKISFNCENIYNKTPRTELDHNGLGNELIQKRLSLLYPERHELKITDNDGRYRVKLNIQVNADRLHNS